MSTASSCRIRYDTRNVKEMGHRRVLLLSVQVSLREGCEKILVADVVTLTEQCVRGRRRALPLGGSAPCELCTGPLRNDGMTSASALRLAACRHMGWGRVI
jgi:hypothetical protein